VAGMPIVPLEALSAQPPPCTAFLHKGKDNVCPDKSQEVSTLGPSKEAPSADVHGPLVQLGRLAILIYVS
jgi:hypothetical protein